MITVECNPWVGLGTAINILSLINSANTQVTIITNESTSIYKQLLPIFDLPNISLTTSSIDHTALGSSDFSKVVSQYFPVGLTQSKKNVIVLTRYNGNVTQELESDIPNNVFPNNRYYSQSIYDHLTTIATLAGYKVIILNHVQMQLPELVEFLKSQCAAVIGYEGGIAHLAHVLQIPTITFPWHHQTNGEPLRDIFGTPNETHLFHLDQKTYIPNNVDELLQWSPEYLRQMISSLEHGYGNNKYLRNYVVKKAHGQLWFCPKDPKKSIVKPVCSDAEFEFIDRYLSDNLTVGGF